MPSWTEVTWVGFPGKTGLFDGRESLNKNTLSKACNIPYTTIDGWYKKGYEGLKLTSLKKLSGFFGVPLDFWANDDTLKCGGSEVKQKVIMQIEKMSEEEARAVLAFIHSLGEVERIYGSEKNDLTDIMEMTGI